MQKICVKLFKQCPKYSKCLVMFAIIIKLRSQQMFVDLLLEGLVVLGDAKVVVPNKG